MDLRKEIENMIENDDGGCGHWILLRHFSDEHSEYWDESKKEAIGGPAFKYADIVMRSYSSPAFSVARPPSKAGVQILEPGEILSDTIKYYFKYNVEVKANDMIYELNEELIKL